MQGRGKQKQTRHTHDFKASYTEHNIDQASNSEQKSKGAKGHAVFFDLPMMPGMFRSKKQTQSTAPVILTATAADSSRHSAQI
jgi:hypothetical protein